MKDIATTQYRKEREIGRPLHSVGKVLHYCPRVTDISQNNFNLISSV